MDFESLSLLEGDMVYKQELWQGSFDFKASTSSSYGCTTLRICKAKTSSNLTSTLISPLSLIPKSWRYVNVMTPISKFSFSITNISNNNFFLKKNNFDFVNFDF